MVDTIQIGSLPPNTTIQPEAPASDGNGASVLLVGGPPTGTGGWAGGSAKVQGGPATADNYGGDAQIVGGDGEADGGGGSVNIAGGSGGTGGPVFVTGGTSTTGAQAGDVRLTGGAVADGGAGPGGNIFLQAGNGKGGGAQGAIQLSDFSNVFVLGLPTADPHLAGALWNSAGTLKISAG